MNLTGFFIENALKVENKKIVVSNRFLDDKKKPIEWEVKAISSAEDENLRRDSMRRFPVPGKKNQYTNELDINRYLSKLAVACTVFPNLNDEGLQNNYKVMGAENLLKTMLTAGEYAEYLVKVQAICGFDQTIEDEVEDAKN